ncbi:hypothetical protein AVEN_16647-1 [Araneus ventricosus]|uniref:Uncharacterized protein n=1 Tax=Araneus ventricosus TaxID=182803 RepID=A0A4Y2KZD7_ARAVE|nr:hypothetical protein AVEN_16647-1 [Araneus ventricosus]
MSHHEEGGETKKLSAKQYVYWVASWQNRCRVLILKLFFEGYSSNFPSLPHPTADYNLWKRYLESELLFFIYRSTIFCLNWIHGLRLDIRNSYLWLNA